MFPGVGVARSATNVFEPQNIFGIERGSSPKQERKIGEGASQNENSPPSAAFREGWGRSTNLAKTNRQLPPVDWTVADADALVAESPCRSSRKFQCRLEIPLVAVRIERQGHHAPVVPGCRLEIRCVEVRVAARICAVVVLAVTTGSSVSPPVPTMNSRMPFFGSEFPEGSRGR